jgi:hypothetical protein
MLYQKIDENLVDWSYAGRPMMDSRPLGDPRQVAALVSALQRPKQPLIVSGSGVIWSRAWAEMQEVRRGRRHAVLHHPAGPRRGAGRSSVLVPVDALLGVPRCRPDHRAGHADELHHRPCLTAALRAERDDRPHRHRCAEESRSAARYVDIPIVGDCKAVLGQLLDGIKGKVNADTYKSVAAEAGGRRAAEAHAAGANKYAEDGDIHPVRMLEEVKNFAKRDAILCVDGQETLNFGRQTMPTFSPGSSFELRSVRHDGRRPAVRHRRQGCLSRQAGDRGARRRLDGHERDGDRHRGAAQDSRS